MSTTLRFKPSQVATNGEYTEVTLEDGLPVQIVGGNVVLQTGDIQLGAVEWCMTFNC